MGTKTAIEWADATWNPWVGCTKVSDACANCYMFRDAARYGRDPEEVKRSSERTFQMPLSRKRVPPGSFVFVCSWSDFFHPDVPDNWRWEALGIMDERKDLTFLILTKRAQEMHDWCDMLEGEWGDSDTSVEDGWIAKHRHIWLGVTAENQERADERVPILLSINWPGKRFVSVEPMLGAVDLDRCIPCGYYCSGDVGHVDHGPNGSLGHLDWVIVGGESGPDARPVHPRWVRSIRDQCLASSVPFMFKQWGEWGPYRGDWPLESHTPGGMWLDDGMWYGPTSFAPAGSKIIEAMTRYGRRRAGRELDGREWLDLPPSRR